MNNGHGESQLDQSNILAGDAVVWVSDDMRKIFVEAATASEDTGRRWLVCTYGDVSLW